MQRTRDGLERVTEIVRALKEFSHPNSEAHGSADLNKAIESTVEIARSEYKQFHDPAARDASLVADGDHQRW